MSSDYGHALGKNKISTYLGDTNVIMRHKLLDATPKVVGYTLPDEPEKFLPVFGQGSRRYIPMKDGVRAVGEVNIASPAIDDSVAWHISQDAAEIVTINNQGVISISGDIDDIQNMEHIKDEDDIQLKLSWIFINRTASGFSNITGIASNGNEIILLFGDGQTSRSLDNGETWAAGGTLQSSNTFPNWRSIAFGNGLFVAVQQNEISYSEDTGISWTTIPAPTTLPWITSPDGDITVDGWFAHWEKITFSNGLFVAGASTHTTHTRVLDSPLMTSADGKSWVRVSVPLMNVPALSVNDMASHNGLFVAIGSNARVATSKNGITWEIHHMWSYFEPYSFSLTSVSTDGDNIVIGTSRNVAISTSDLIEWKWNMLSDESVSLFQNELMTRTSGAGVVGSLFSMSANYNNVIDNAYLGTPAGIFITFVRTIDWTHKIAISTTGRKWALPPMPEGNWFTFVTLANNRVIAIGNVNSYALIIEWSD